MVDQTTNKSKHRWVPAIALVFALLVAAIFGKIIGLGLSGTFAPRQEVNDEFIDESLKEVSNQINSDCPIVLDKTTTLVSSQYYNSTFKYIYVFDWEAYGTENLTDLQEKLRPGVVNYYCTNPNMSLFRELEVAVYYTYLDKNKNHLFEISVMPGECKSNEG
jgi:hypothetical protein